MKILFYGSCFPPTPYGPSRFNDCLARALVRCGHSVVVVTSSVLDMPAYEEQDGLRIYRIGDSRVMRSEAGAAVATRIAKEQRIDLIQGVEYLGECAALVRCSQRPPVCIHLCTSISLRVLRRSLAYFPWQRLTVTLACLRSWRQWRDELTIIRQSDMLFAPSRRALAELKHQGTRVPALCEMVSNPVDVPTGWKNEEAEDPTVLYVGRLDFGKGIGSLPSIMRDVRRAVPNVKLVIAGGDQYACLVGSLQGWLARQFGAFLPQVSFMGRLNRTALDECFRRAWVVVVPSRWDSCSNVTLEAMARAKPVVVSPHGGMPELVAGTGAPVKDPDVPGFADAVVALLQSREKREELGRQLRAKVDCTYRPDMVIDAYCRFVESNLRKSAEYR